MAEASKSPTDISAIAEDPGDRISPQMAGELLIEHFGDVHLARTRLNDAICQNRAATYADGVRVPAHYFAGCMQFTLNATADRFEIRPFAGLHGPNPETGLPYVWTVSRKSVLDLIGGNKQVVADKPGEPVAHHPQRELIRLVVDRIYPSGVVPPTKALPFSKLKRQLKKEWERDPELANQSLPSDSSIKRETGRKKH